jgi:hypothetical protein
VGRIALVAAVLAGLTAPAGLAAHHPRWTAKGKLARLNSHAITVDGRSCRITSTSARPAIKVFLVGSTVKIVCDDGVLLEIDLLRPPPSQSGTGSAGSVTSSSSSSNSSSSALAIAGDFSIAALGSGSITVGAGSASYTCTIGAGSPDVSAYRVGGHVSKLTCKDGVLTAIAA